MTRRAIAARAVTTSDAEIDAALVRAREYDERRPRCVGVEYRSPDDAIVVELATGVVIVVPRRLIQGLGDASPAQVADVTAEDHGAALHWNELDLDHSVAGLIDGVFGTRDWMRAIGKRGGRSRSNAKAAAVRANGVKGGRPRKTGQPLG